MLKKIWYHLEEFVALPILVFQVCLVSYQVVMRYIFTDSPSWTEELARYLFVWLMWFGVSYSARNRSHLRITMVRDALPEKASRILELVVTLIWLGFGIFVVIKGCQMVSSIITYKQVSAALRLPMQYAYMGVPIGASLMCIRLSEFLYLEYILPLTEKGEGESDKKEAE